MADVFVSYKAEDRHRVQRLVEALESDGLSVWWDSQIGAGDSWRDSIQQALDASRCVIVIWSRRSIGPGGHFVRDEATRAQRRGIYLPVRIDRVDPPIGFGEIQALALNNWKGDRADERYRALLASARAIASGEPRPGHAYVEEPRASRRAVIVGGTAATMGIAAGAGWFWLRRNDLSPEAQSLVQAAREGVNDGGVDVNANAIGKLRRAADLEPEAAVVWGLLALAYVQQSRMAPVNDRQALLARGLAAAKRSQSLERHQPEGMAAQILAMPMFRNWYAVEHGCRAALEKHPRNPYLLMRLAMVLGQVGRDEECLSCIDEVLEAIPTPIPHVGRTTVLWNLGRLDEAEAELNRTFSLWPRHYAIWFTRFYYLLYNGRATEALALMDDTASRPIGIPSWNFDLVTSQARALAGGNSVEISSALEALEKGAHRAAGFAENAAIFASYTRNLDVAFKILNGLYMNRGFAVADTWFSAEQAIYMGRERNTYILFQRPMAVLRKDPRFYDLCRKIGLDNYWRKTGSREHVVA